LDIPCLPVKMCLLPWSSLLLSTGMFLSVIVVQRWFYRYAIDIYSCLFDTSFVIIFL
jgi:hypothetical protein